MELKNKVVVITGAGTGLGKTVAIKLAKKRMKIALVGRTKKELEEVKKEIINKKGEAEYFICDIRNLKQIKTTVKEIFKRFQTIDILINNAGIWSDENLEKNDPERRKLTIETNALGHINFTYELLPYFKKRNQGYIFNVISTSGTNDSLSGNNALWKTYGASKWAMRGFTNGLMQDLKSTKIKVTGFYPGGFDSMLYEKALRKNPHNQPWMMKTEDIADIVVFILERPNDVLIEKIVISKII